MNKYHFGVNWEQHSSAVLYLNGECLGALSNERISRRKNDEAYPKEAINLILMGYQYAVFIKMLFI